MENNPADDKVIVNQGSSHEITTVSDIETNTTVIENECDQEYARYLMTTNDGQGTSTNRSQ